MVTAVGFPGHVFLESAHTEHSGAGFCELQGELDELEREEFFRLKKVQDKKQRDHDLVS